MYFKFNNKYPRIHSKRKKKKQIDHLNRYEMYEGRLTLMNGILKSQKNYEKEEEEEEEEITKKTVKIC